MSRESWLLLLALWACSTPPKKQDKSPADDYDPDIQEKIERYKPRPPRPSPRDSGAAQSVTFPRRTEQVGQVTVVKNYRDLRYVVRSGGATSDLLGANDEETRYEVLAVEGETATKYKTTYVYILEHRYAKIG